MIKYLYKNRVDNNTLQVDFNGTHERYLEVLLKAEDGRVDPCRNVPIKSVYQLEA